MKDLYIFPAIFEESKEGVSIEFPDFPGCLPCGENIDQAVKNAKEALHLHLYGMEKDGDLIPEPSSLTVLKPKSNQSIMLIEAYMMPFREKMANKYVNTTVTLPKWLKEFAEKEKLNFSQILQGALKERLQKYDYKHIR